MAQPKQPMSTPAGLRHLAVEVGAEEIMVRAAADASCQGQAREETRFEA